MMFLDDDGAKEYGSEGLDVECEEVDHVLELSQRQQDKVNRLVDSLLEKNLREFAFLVSRYLKRPCLRRNTMTVLNTAKASLRYGVSPTAEAAIASEYLKDVIAAGHLPQEKSYLACDRGKLVRARKETMKVSRETDFERHEGTEIIGLGYDGRRDPHTRAMVSDSLGNQRMRIIKEEHESVSEEPSGKYLAHFVLEPANPLEKPALKVAQALYDLLVQYNSTDSIQILLGDSTNQNTGWKAGIHAHLEKLLDRRLFLVICDIHTNEH